MTSYFFPVLAQSGQPLLGNQWLALFVILGSVTAFVMAIAAVGRWLAATHPNEPAKAIQPTAPTETVVATPGVPSTSAPVANPETPVEIFAAIAAAVAVTLGAKARVAAINLVPSQPAPETTLQWSLEGRRQIYSSHKVR